jgi:hypothetical protein
MENEIDPRAVKMYLARELVKAALHKKLRAGKERSPSKPSSV